MKPPSYYDEDCVRGRNRAESAAMFVINSELRRAKFIERLRSLAHQEELHGKPVLNESIVEELIGLAR